jgi:hypothetical protein
MTAELITKSLFSSVVVIFQNFHSFVIKTRVRLNKIQAFLFTIFFHSIAYAVFTAFWV